MLPRPRIAVAVDETHQGEHKDRRTAEKENDSLTFLRRLPQHRTEHEPESHDPGPGNERVKIDPEIAGGRRHQRTRHMQQTPEYPRRSSHRLGIDRIERVVPEHK